MNSRMELGVRVYAGIGSKMHEMFYDCCVDYPKLTLV